MGNKLEEVRKADDIQVAIANKLQTHFVANETSTSLMGSSQYTGQQRNTESSVDQYMPNPNQHEYIDSKVFNMDREYISMDIHHSKQNSSALHAKESSISSIDDN